MLSTSFLKTIFLRSITFSDWAEVDDDVNVKPYHHPLHHQCGKSITWKPRETQNDWLRLLLSARVRPCTKPHQGPGGLHSLSSLQCSSSGGRKPGKFSKTDWTDAYEHIHLKYAVVIILLVQVYSMTLKDYPSACLLHEPHAGPDAGGGVPVESLHSLSNSLLQTSHITSKCY